MWKLLNGYKTVASLIGLVLTPLVSVGGNVGKLAHDGLQVLGPLGMTLEGLFGIGLAVGLAHKAVKAERAE